ncbi:MAG: hypothetical protein K8I29_18495 [Alphaproteobacteria bacterium]|uniref:Uncharacterized protein n=1 Tax=Candidatus Nitrobium versatile TaxID=2884831 RepID=A0A953M3C4_9BACT|nr:hypothetical protein [Candidatus Nitrobium versatile]
MREHRVFLIVFAVFFLLAGVSFAEGKPDAGSGLNAYSKGEFDPKAEALPGGFLGHDIVEVFTAEGDRKSGSASAPYAFTVEDGSGVVFSPYHSRSRSVKISLVLHSVTSPSAPEAARWAITIKDIDKRTESYIGCTKCGVQQKVAALFKDSYALAILNTGRIVHEKKKGTAHYAVTVKGISPSAARALKDTAALLVVCAPAASLPNGPVPFRGEYRVSWTVYKPVDITKDIHYVPARIAEIWVYDRTTGKIYAKERISPL